MLPLRYCCFIVVIRCSRNSVNDESAYDMQPAIIKPEKTGCETVRFMKLNSGDEGITGTVLENTMT